MEPGPGKCGSAALVVTASQGGSAVTTAWARSPLALLTPRAAGHSVWACTSNYGGGMLGGDETSLSATVDDGACCFLITQASTKIYKNPRGLPCSHAFKARVGKGATLISAPDPVQCFAGASFKQTQQIHLSASSNLALVDWVSAGRTARGERWAFNHFQSKIEVFREDRLIFLDHLVLDPGLLPPGNPFALGRWNCFATALLLGPAFEQRSRQLLEESHDTPVMKGSALLRSASPVQEGVILRIAAERVETAGQAITAALAFVKSFLRDDPWARKW